VEKLKNYQLSVPLTEEERNYLDLVKSEKGIAKGWYVKQAIKERMIKDKEQEE